MAEGEQRNRHGQQRRGQWMAFFLAVFGLLGGGTLAYFDRSLEGLAAMIVSIAIVVGVFVTSRRQSREKTRPPVTASEA